MAIVKRVTNNNKTVSNYEETTAEKEAPTPEISMKLHWIALKKKQKLNEW